ncbi:MAG: PQQ-binding-like beta-propeller repeat protein [Candidatus Paceibacterota bacterium]
MKKILFLVLATLALATLCASGCTPGFLKRAHPEETKPVKKWKFVAKDISSPVIGTDGCIYLLGSGLLYAINPDGTKKWEIVTGGGSGPAIGADGTVYCAGDGVYAINPDGTQKWVFGLTESTEDWSFSFYSPAIGPDGTIYVEQDSSFRNAIYSSSLYAINPDGTKKWEIQNNDLSDHITPTIGSDGTIFFIHGMRTFTPKLYAINPDGAQKWVYDGVIGRPVVSANGTVYTKVSGTGGTGICLLAINKNGTKKWKIGSIDTAFLDPIIGKDGTIYAGDGGNKFYAIRPDGKVKWIFKPTGSQLPDDNAVYAVWDSRTAISTEGTIYFNAAYYYLEAGYQANKLQAINPNGTKKWEMSLGFEMANSPVVASDGSVYITDPSGGVLYAYKD